MAFSPGQRVKYTDGRAGPKDARAPMTGTVKAVPMETGKEVAVELDPSARPDGKFHGAQTCDGNVPSGRGWWFREDKLEAL